MNENIDDSSSRHGRVNDVRKMDDMNPNVIKKIGEIRLPPILKNATFMVTEPLLQLVKIRGLFRCFEHEYPNDYLHKFVNVCGPFPVNGISQESMRLMLFLFSLMGEANRWLIELPSNFITSWEELTEASHKRFFPPSKVMKLRDGIQKFKKINGKPVHEVWLRFKKVLLQCPNHGLPDKLLLQYFYRSCDAVNTGLAYHLNQGGIVRQPFVVASRLLDEMKKINQAWYTKEDHV
ncbi:hypothetical protein R3W88_014572 [Solanum pinnatisectum]|uniref:Retrotransposon gag domain-containing protein n=1 Tax=Solanum pinnatisectum TaxID=50273 RepID=A0AAV9KSD6_9SOLN|nr:hypothetical protein R3W88_014572 [Solanum pinnatisectum]